MIIGSYEACTKKRLGAKILTKILGTTDYHTHIRLRPIIKVCKKKAIYGTFLEIGCGSGTVAFELNRRGHIKNYVGIDLNTNSINNANTMQKSLGQNNLTFVAEDAFKFLKSINNQKQKYDYIILYDFLEHIPDPEQFLKDLYDCLGSKRIVFLISVPTPKYPKVFGRDFHELIGHLVDGYTKKQLDCMFQKINFKSVYSEYNTGLFGNMGAYIFYHFKKNVHPRVLCSLTLPFRIFDINSKKISSSLFSVYIQK